MVIKEKLDQPELQKEFLKSLEGDKELQDKIDEVNKESEKLSEEEIEEGKIRLREIYEKLKEILRNYNILNPLYYNIISLWIIGTYHHDLFPTYPYLFFNAPKSSGKTRLLKLISVLSKNGVILTDLKEAVLFRTAKDTTFCIDELERIGTKEKSTLRELLNVGYKKGLEVRRMKKVNIGFKEDYVVEKFEAYCPIAMANIWGMDEVLEDRCLSLILERAQDKTITRILEDYENDYIIKYILDNIVKCSYVVKCSLNQKKYIGGWNNFLWNIRNITTLTTQTTLNQDNFYKKVYESELDGRDLELFFPLLIISYLIGEDIFSETLKFSQKISEEKHLENILESKDGTLIEFLADLEETGAFLSVRTLTEEFKGFLKEEERTLEWLNSKWFGKAIKRANLVISKRRTGSGIEVIIDFKKVKNKANLIGLNVNLNKKEENQEELVIPLENKLKECVSCGLRADIIEADGSGYILDEKGLCEYCREPEEESVI